MLFRSGGLVGRKPGEVPIMAHKGEVVIPKNMVGKGNTAVGNETSINNQLGPVSVTTGGEPAVTAGTQQAKQFGENIRALIAQEMVRESRPGGLLRPGSGSPIR